MRRGVFQGFRVRWGLAGLAVLFAAACAAAVASGAQRASPPGVLAVRLGGDSGETRIVVDLDRPASGRIEDTVDGQLSLMLSDVAPRGILKGAGKGLVRGWTAAPAGGSTRVTLNLAQAASVERRFLLPPADGVTNYRYVVDIAAKPGARRLPAAAPAENIAPPAPLPPPSQSASRRTRRVIVIDAGHGGRDPGAEGAGTAEKDVTLSAALTLKAKLERTGRYQVVLTRAADVYVPLETRVQIARRAGADLFISLHADSGPDAGIHGASVYTLSDRGVGRVGYVLDRHDWFLQPTAAGDDHAVGQILLDLTQRSTRNRSAIFAETLINHVADRAPLLARSHRDANYFVLLAPDVPAVLLEMGFITNPGDEARLSNPDQRGSLMTEVADAVDAYFGAPSTRLAAR